MKSKDHPEQKWLTWHFEVRKPPILFSGAAKIWIFLCCSLAGVSRSTTMVVAYLMTVTHYSWDECLSAVKAVRSFVGPNYGFQQQLQEYQAMQLSEVNARAPHTHTLTHSHKTFDSQTTVRTLLWQWFFRFFLGFVGDFGPTFTRTGQFSGLIGGADNVVYKYISNSANSDPL